MNIRVICEDFFKYIVPGILTTALEIEALIFLLARMHTRGFWYIFAVGVTFIIGTTLQYLFVHLFIFRDSDREFKEGYVYFMLVAIIGLALTLILVILFTYVTHVPPIRARVITACIVGIWNFIGNYFLSFEMHKKREEALQKSANVQQ